MTLIATNPADGSELARFEEPSPEELEGKLAKAQAAYLDWRERPLSERAALVEKVATALRDNAEDLARLATAEMGKVLKESRGEVEKSAWFCEWYAERAEELLAPRLIEGGQLENWVRYDPLGVLLAVMPWNFPYVQVFRFAPPALVAGNVIVLKHASNVPQCALRIEQLFLEAGFPEGVFQTLLIGSKSVEKVLSDPRVQGVTLTGSEAAGSSVASIAGRELKTSVMELGGSDPFIVLDDADVRSAAAEGAKSRFTNAGQACINAKRFIVVDAVADAFEQALIDEVAQLRVGDPTDPDTTTGPLARLEFVDTLREQVQDSIAAGATLRIGGFADDPASAFVEPIVLTGVGRDMRVFREETFGPVAAIVRVPDEEAAIELANDSDYGLGASVWTADLDRGRRVAARVEAGMVFVNAQVVSDARLPFGGVKRSGYGRELGEWGIREFTDVKSVAIVASPGAPDVGMPAGAAASNE
jgi:succinate-semialdehyde dehydrogenase/glutarate-semialdehyde dehydrogenase